MVDFIIGPLLVFLLLGGWVLVQHIARTFAKNHPELGPYREEGGGCGGGCCGCSEPKECGNEKSQCGVIGDK